MDDDCPKCKGHPIQVVVKGRLVHGDSTRGSLFEVSIAEEEEQGGNCEEANSSLLRLGHSVKGIDVFEEEENKETRDGEPADPAAENVLQLKKDKAPTENLRSQDGQSSLPGRHVARLTRPNSRGQAPDDGHHDEATDMHTNGSSTIAAEDQILVVQTEPGDSRAGIW